MDYGSIRKLLSETKCFYDFNDDFFRWEAIIGAFFIDKKDIESIASAYDLKCEILLDNYEGECYRIKISSEVKEGFLQDVHSFFKSIADIILLDKKQKKEYSVL